MAENPYSCYAWHPLPTAMKKTDYLERILARPRLRRRHRDRRSSSRPNLSARTGNHVLLKREDMQPVFSFKLRGAYNKMAHLPPAQLKRGVIAASAGNHAQGVALAAQQARLPRHHRDADHHAADQDRGGARRAARRVVLHGDSYDEAYAHARAAGAASSSLTFVHPYDDPGRDRRPGHHRHGNPAPASGAHPRHLRAPSAAAD